MIITFISTVSYMTYLYVKAGVGWWYTIIIISTALFFTVPTYILRNTHDLHIHHTNIGMFLTLIFGYQNVLVTVFHGIANGVMIEGGARWGYDPIWEKKNVDHGCEYSQ